MGFTIYWKWGVFCRQIFFHLVTQKKEGSATCTTYEVLGNKWPTVAILCQGKKNLKSSYLDHSFLHIVRVLKIF